MAPDIVGCPALTEVFAAHGQFPDQVGQALVEGVASALRAQQCHGGVGRQLPVGVKVPGQGVEEDEPGVVGRPCGSAVHLRVQGVAELVGRHNVQVVVADDGRRRCDGVEHELQGGTDRSALKGALTGPGGGPGCTGKVVEVLAFGVVEPQRPGDGVQNTFGGAGQIPSLKLRVVVHAHPGKHRNLFTAQAGDPASAVHERKTGHLGGDLGPS
jgi:hypothetical protein